MGLYTKGLGALFGFNGQVLAAVWLCLTVQGWLEEQQYAGGWIVMLWLSCFTAIFHSCFVLFRYLAKIEKQYRREAMIRNRTGGEGKNDHG